MSSGPRTPSRKERKFVECLLRLSNKNRELGLCYAGYFHASLACTAQMVARHKDVHCLHSQKWEQNFLLPAPHTHHVALSILLQSARPGSNASDLKFEATRHFNSLEGTSRDGWVELAAAADVLLKVAHVRTIQAPTIRYQLKPAACKISGHQHFPKNPARLPTHFKFKASCSKCTCKKRTGHSPLP